MNTEISADPARLRIDDIQGMLSKTYWSPGISKNEIEKGIRNSALVVGVYDDAGRQVGFCRVISDKTRFAYLLDVIVAEDCLHRGIGLAMVRFTVTHSDLKDVYQWLLKTSDAHGVYGKCGFVPIEDPERWMGRIQLLPERGEWDEGVP
ncbi:MAG: GNAT family N-acetyltransferase [Methanoregula sp.]|jgi:N-acetylglutamate synthase-like GNAT family acetyltransferase|uniref:GNAT family N-acetyltransferase n=1 Tax=Methanoregula sp. TaxID=2052170 RepID=UPI003C1E31A3